MMADTYNGMRISIAELYPNMQVSREFARIQDPDLVARTNAWMAEFFGYRETVPDGQIIAMEQMGVLVMNATTYAKLRTAIALENAK